MKKKFLISLVLILVVVLFGILFFSLGNSKEVLKVNPDKFEKLVGEDIFVLQVHTPYYKEINGTDLVIEDWENIEDYLDLLPEKDVPIAVYCMSGRMSGIVSEKLSNLGYQVVYDLKGGMNAWEASGRNLVEGKR